MARYTGETYDTFNALAQRTLRYPALERDALTYVFMEIEELIHYGIHVLLQTTSFVEDNLCYLMSEIACGQIKNRKVYRGKRSMRKIDVGQDIEIGSTNSRIFGIGFDLFKLSKTDRDVAVPLVQKVLRTLRLSTNIYENILTSFLKEAKDYCLARDQLAALTLRIQRDRRRKPLIADMKHIGDLIDDVQLLEMSVGCVRTNELYGTVRIVKGIVDRVRMRQDNILKAYLRLVPKLARHAAESEVEALDFFQSGSLGLATAISRYNVRKGAHFHTFAQVWIRQRILGSRKHSSPIIRLPNSVLENYQKIRAAERRLKEVAATRDTYTDADLAEESGLSIRSIKNVRQKMQQAHVVHLSTVTPDGESGYDFIPSGTVDDDEAELMDARASIEAILDHLDAEERRLVCLKYGYIEGVPNDTLNPTEGLRERLRQLARSAKLHRSMANTPASSSASVPLPA